MCTDELFRLLSTGKSVHSDGICFLWNKRGYDVDRRNVVALVQSLLPESLMVQACYYRYSAREDQQAQKRSS